MARNYAQEFYDWVIENRSDYEVLGTYQGALTKIEMRHKACGEPWSVRPSNFKKGDGCPECLKNKRVAAAKEQKGKRRVRWNNQLIQQFLDENRPGWRIIGAYRNKDIPVEFLCDRGHDTTQAWGHIKRGINCSTCALQDRTTKPYEFELQMCEASDFQYVLVSSFVDMKTKVDLLHLKCGEIYSVRPDHFTSTGSRCSCETGSYGEGFMKALLLENNIKFTEQQTFEGLVDKGFLRFDFFIPSLNTAIEIQGRQHYEAVDFFGGEEQLQDQQRRDNLKRDFCLVNSIKLIELPYFSKSDTDTFKDILVKEGIL